MSVLCLRMKAPITSSPLKSQQTCPSNITVQNVAHEGRYSYRPYAFFVRKGGDLPSIYFSIPVVATFLLLAMRSTPPPSLGTFSR